MRYIEQQKVELHEARKEKKHALIKKEEAKRMQKEIVQQKDDEIAQCKLELTAVLEKVRAYKQKASASDKAVRQKDQEIVFLKNEQQVLEAKVEQQLSTNETLNKKVSNEYALTVSC